jgi:hypothetical protein
MQKITPRNHVPCAIGYNEFDFFLENAEYRPFDGCKIEIKDTYKKHVF